MRHRYVQAVLTCIGDDQIVALHAIYGLLGQPLIDADAMVDVHHIVALFELPQAGERKAATVGAVFRAMQLAPAVDLTRSEYHQLRLRDGKAAGQIGGHDVDRPTYEVIEVCGDSHLLQAARR